MWSSRHLLWFLGLALAGVARFAYGDAPNGDSVASTATPPTVVVISSSAADCKEMTVEQARSLADQAFRNGAFRRAAECYLAAGQPALADRAFVKAASQSGAQTAHQFEANSLAAQAQFRQLAQAFRHR